MNEPTTIPDADQSPRVDRWKMACLVLAVVLCITAIWVAMGFIRTRIEKNETTAITTLKLLASAQARFQAAGKVDQDGDGTGEYGFLSELGGLVGLRSSGAEIGEDLAKSAIAGRGIATHSGMHYLVWLPTASGRSMRETGVPRASEPSSADAQENRFIIYAWPVWAGFSANRTFVISHQGEVYGTVNPSDSVMYAGLDELPQADAALVANSMERGNLLGILRPDLKATDGLIWGPAG